MIVHSVTSVVFNNNKISSNNISSSNMFSITNVESFSALSNNYTNNTVMLDNPLLLYSNCSNISVVMDVYQNNLGVLSVSGGTHSLTLRECVFVNNII